MLIDELTPSLKIFLVLLPYIFYFQSKLFFYFVYTHTDLLTAVPSHSSLRHLTRLKSVVYST